MPTEEEGRPRSVELEQAIKHRIVQPTGGRIQMLQIEVIGNRVVCNGCAPNYYLKQLVLQGVLDVVGPAGTGGVEFNVQMAARPPESVESAD